MDFNRFATDTKAEVSGKWFKFGDAELLIARTGNLRYREHLRTKLQMHGAELSRGVIDLQLNDEILCEVLAETILLDWKGFTENNKECRYSKEKAKEVLLKYKDFRDLVVEKAEAFENFSQTAREEDLGNSEPDSSGTSNTGTQSSSSKGSPVTAE